MQSTCQRIDNLLEADGKLGRRRIGGGSEAEADVASSAKMLSIAFRKLLLTAVFICQELETADHVRFACNDCTEYIYDIILV